MTPQMDRDDAGKMTKKAHDATFSIGNCLNEEIMITSAEHRESLEDEEKKRAEKLRHAGKMGV